MATLAKARHFDYLKKHGAYVEDILSWEGFSKRISWWRSSLLQDPDAVTVGCRKAVENLLVGLFEDESEETRPSLIDMIDMAEDEGIIGHRTAKQCTEIRRIGNRGAHMPTVKEVDAKCSLELLDDILRWFVAENCGSDDFDPNPREYSDEIIVTEGRESISSLNKRASTAAALSEDRSIERAAASISSKAKAQDAVANEALDKLDKILGEINSLDVGKEEKTKAIEACSEKAAALASAAKSIEEQLDETSNRIDEILSEHDYIKALLTTPGEATPNQMEVLAFPKSSNTKTNVLKLQGVAGSGKTLCLLAKLIRNVRGDQGALVKEAQPRALFVCFNKPLAHHIEELLEQCSDAFPFAKDRIEVRSFDKFINSLVKPEDRADEPNPFVSSARYKEPKWSIHYETMTDSVPFRITKRAMENVAERHPGKEREYYLDSSSDNCAYWMAEEIRWLAAAYDGPEEAQPYIDMAPRKGRGGQRLPNTEIRKIIIEVWQEYLDLLAASNHYTLEQALWRLLKADRLPQYEAIAIDETQDLSSLAVRVLYRMKSDSKNALMYIAGDEEQKIYHKDFTFKELDERAVGYTITLGENKRNSKAIQAFADRLIGAPKRKPSKNDGVYVGDWEDEALALVVRKAIEAKESVAVIGPSIPLAKDLRYSGFVHQIGALSPKGLEFDNVIVNYIEDFAETPDEERRLRYVHFTRARKRLYVRLSDDVPELMKEYYPDYLDAV